MKVTTTCIDIIAGRPFLRSHEAVAVEIPLEGPDGQQFEIRVVEDDQMVTVYIHYPNDITEDIWSLWVGGGKEAA